MFTKAHILIYGLAHLTSAHMKMSTPVPYGRSSLNNSPLLGSGEDFPCKLRPNVYNIEGASNNYALGSTNQLTFIGQAVHAGGSCQVSITYDSQPTKNSVWKVIRSIEGGCPAQGQTGNMGDDASAADPYTYEFTIPADIPAGNGTIAWTWFNKVGLREMYMNCGPVILTGTGGARANYDALPDMFKANINNGCGVPDGRDVVFPSPGNDIVRLNGVTDAFATPTGASCGAAGPTLTPVITSPASSNTPNTYEQTGRNGAMDPGSLCTEEGLWNCVNHTSFQRCASGQWSLLQQLPAGISCRDGISVGLD